MTYRSWPGLFIIGTGRCGSSLLRRTLRDHPDAYLPQETHWIPILHDFFGRRPVRVENLFDALSQVYLARGKATYERILTDSGISDSELRAGVSERLGAAGSADLATFMTAFYDTLAARHGAHVWGDKTPDYGQCMGLLKELWPGARFVNIVRDGRDAALSMIQVPSFRYLVAWKAYYWPTLAWRRAYEAKAKRVEQELPLDEFFQLWRRRFLRIRDESRRLPAGDYLEVEYDALLSRPRPTLERICAHVGLEPATDWMETAAAAFRTEQLGKNRARPEYRELTARFGAELEQLGFAP